VIRASGIGTGTTQAVHFHARQSGRDLRSFVEPG
jgi:hypothetical protein